MAVHTGLRIVELGPSNRDYGATRIVPLVTVDPAGTRREWHIHAMMPGVASLLRTDVPMTFYATDIPFMKVLNGVRVDGEPGHFESRMASVGMLAIAFAACLLFLVLAPLLVFLPFLGIAILVFAASISANLMKRRFRRDERRLVVQSRILVPDP